MILTINIRVSLLARAFACVWIAMSGIVSFAAAKEDISQLPVIHSSSDYYAVSGEQRNVYHSIDTECRVTFYDRDWNNLWVEQNGTVGYFPIHAGPFPLHSNQRISIKGKVLPAQGLSKDEVTVRVLAENDPAPALNVEGRFSELKTLDRHPIECNAFVDTQWVIDSHHLRLSLIIENRPIIGWILLEDGKPLPDLKNTFIHLRSVFSFRNDPSGTRPEVELWASGTGSVKILHTLASDPNFAIPSTPIDQLFESKGGEIVRVHGVLQSQEAGVGLVVRDETGQINVEDLQEHLLPIGTEIDVLGRNTVSRGVSLLAGALARVAPSAQKTAAATPFNQPISAVEEVRSLTKDEAAAARKVELRGVVTWSQPDSSYLFLQGLTGGVRVRFKLGSINVPIIGKNVLITGRTFAYGAVAAVDLEKITDLGAMRLPQARLINFSDAMTGAEDAQWVEMHGYLRNSEIKNGKTYLEIATPDGEITATIQTPEHFETARDALIRIQGVCETNWEDGRRVVGFKIWIPYLHNILIEEEAPADVFDIPLRTIPSLRTLTALSTVLKAKVEGVVILHQPGEFAFLEGGESGLLVLARSSERLVPGDRVEVVGLVGRQGDRTLLRDAVYRKTGTAPVPRPVQITDVSKIYDALDGRLVTVRGTLVNKLNRPQHTRLALQSGATLFETIIEQSDPNKSPQDLDLGSGLEMTGVYQVTFDESRQSRGFELLLRSSNDITVFKKARIWTAQRAIAAASILGGCLVVGLGWVTALRRRLARQTDQIRAQLQKEMVWEERHRGIVENASDFIFTTDVTGRFTSFNPAGERMTGFSSAEAMNMKVADLLVSEEGNGHGSGPAPVPDENGTSTFQSQLRTRDGRNIWIETSSRIIREDGRSVGTLGIVRDISERKLIEEELKRARDAAESNTRAKSEFLANMSHEIRTPMNAVIGMSNLMLDTNLDERQRDFAETIRNGAEALLTVLNDILDFSKMEAGRLRIEAVNFELRDAVDGTVELLGGRAAAKGLELTAFVPARLPSSVRGDPGRLRQVLLNMLGNALKFTERGEVILQVSVEAETDHEVRYLFEIIDSGVGLSLDEQTRLFKPFAQADSSTTRRFGGTGLGLAICKQIVDLLGGRCGVRSTLGEGATFWFTAKFAKQTHEKKAAVDSVRLNGIKILLVDDSTSACRLMDHYASAWGMRTTDANLGAEAMDALRSAASTGEPFSMAVIDGRMPDMDGATLAREIRSDPTLAALRIVLLNSLDRPVMPSEMQQLGLSASLLKPIRQSEFLSALLRAAPLSDNPTSDLGGSSPRGLTHSTVASHSFSANGALSVAPVSLSILLAEDNLVNQRVAMLQLEKLGHQTHAVANGLEALNEFQRGRYDIILMDCHMPEMDGFEATRRIRALATGNAVRIVALTANAMQGDREKCLAAGMDDYLSKPVRVAELQAALTRNAPAS